MSGLLLCQEKDFGGSKKHEEDGGTGSNAPSLLTYIYICRVFRVKGCIWGNGMAKGNYYICFRLRADIKNHPSVLISNINFGSPYILGDILYSR